MTATEILEAIHAERARQVLLQQSGKFRYTCADKELNLSDKLLVLCEEVGEVSRAILSIERLTKDDKFTEPAKLKDLTKELVQVMAVCHAWLESLP